MSKKESLTLNSTNDTLIKRKWFLKKKGKIFVKIKLTQEEFERDKSELFDLDGIPVGEYE